MRLKKLNALFCVAILSMGICVEAVAQRVETIAPQHQLADALAETLQATFPQAGIRAFSGQLIISAPDDATFNSIIALMRQLDRPMRQLRVTVEQRSLQSQNATDLSLQGGVVVSNSGVGGRLVLQGDDRSQQSNRQSRQTLRLLDGTEGMIQIGEQRFVPMIRFAFRPGYTIAQYGGQWQSAGTGFYVAPQLVGERQVLVKIAPQSSRFIRQGQQQTQSAYSEVRGDLGEWLPIGESEQRSSGKESGLLSGSNSQSAQRYSVWLKVEME